MFGRSRRQKQRMLRVSVTLDLVETLHSNDIVFQHLGRDIKVNIGPGVRNGESFYVDVSGQIVEVFCNVSDSDTCKRVKEDLYLIRVLSDRD